MAYQSRDVVEAMEGDMGSPMRELRVDGGAAVMDVLCQFQADCSVFPSGDRARRDRQPWAPRFWRDWGPDLEGQRLKDLWKPNREFEPAMSRTRPDLLQSQWREQSREVEDWADPINQ